MSSIATHYSKESIAGRRREGVPCPRCMEPCGWCSDPRWVHGTVNLPGTRKRCGVPGYEPEGQGCPLCKGSMRVTVTTTYEAEPKTSSDPEPKSSVNGQAQNTRAQQP